MSRTTSGSLRDWLEDTFWERHANSKSGWSRVLIGPLFLVAVYRRDWRLFVVAVLAAVINPVAFARPDPEEDSWMTRAVRAERWWLDQGNRTVGLGWPNVLTALAVPASGYALYAAYTRQPVRATVSFALAMGCKFGWIEAISRKYDAANEA
ncbi:DUF6653 family protein [Halostagnicola sp. A-GB9-2]|uniref:DUF6653 family protein n=1 Tax=Halostagnicola sp. A-GB9-2 TaxID=3048066 RepID=UPI0024C09E35|nr:DUF6653 family protein [Halostagnicola sp. A-GB9-2]MDJ1431456.1 hypothetical protein [Halostagnicola sp. A-GB9-2]